MAEIRAIRFAGTELDRYLMMKGKVIKPRAGTIDGQESDIRMSSVLTFSSSQSSSSGIPLLSAIWLADVWKSQGPIQDRPERLQSILAEAGPWVIGIDFPFGLPRPFVDSIGMGYKHVEPIRRTRLFLPWEALE